ncbi:putative ankyrin repeat protein RF_0381 [Liolophura sinensis]|uniref:putative ankyrin repeat protein RF_0381 n=1 Tax=Liolophura sinensis TaxID=3198878 RepID=UPI0031587A7E
MAILLIRYGADVNFSRSNSSASKETPLMRAVQLNHKEMCEALIDAGCHVNAKTPDDVTALHYAVASRRYDICHFLLEKGAEVHTETNHGITALAIAVDHQNPTMVRTLASFGYDLDATYRWGETPLEHAMRIHSEKCAISMVHLGCGLKRTVGQSSYFFHAMSEGMIRLAKLMLEVRPMFSQDEWIRTEQWPLALYHKPEVCQWLAKKAKTPPRLKALCRGKVLRYLGLRPHQKIETLSLPFWIKRYLELKRQVTPSFYGKPSLDKPDCPYQCPVLCTQEMCPPLDISSDESGVG